MQSFSILYTILYALYNVEYYNFLPSYINSIRINQNICWTYKDCSYSTKLESYNDKLLKFDFNSTCNKNIIIIGTIYNLDIIKDDYKYTRYFNNSLDIEKSGIRIFSMNENLIYPLVNLYETVSLFKGVMGSPNVSPETENKNINFLKNIGNINFEKVNNKLSNVNKISSGDFLAIVRLDGLDPLISWATGSHLGHTTFVIDYFNNGRLYVLESQTSSNYWEKNGIQKTPLDEWLKLSERASYNVIRIHLKNKYQKIFNENTKKIVTWFETVEGLDYGYHNFLFGWIDNHNNLPTNYNNLITYHHIMLLFAHIEPYLDFINKHITFVPDIYIEGLNKRLNTQNLKIIDIFNEMYRRNLTFIDLISIPEDDNWEYSNGKNMVCDVFLCNAYRIAGLFDNISVNCSEFTPFDFYELDWWNTSTDYIMGNYNIRVPKLGTIKPFNNMRNNCSTDAPLFNIRNKEKYYC